MLINFITTNNDTDNSLLKTLFDWRLLIFIVCILCCILILFCWWKQYIKKLIIKQNLRQRLNNDHHRLFNTSTVDTIRKIPLQKSVSKRRAFVSKSLKRNNRKSLLNTKKSRRTAKTDPPVDSSSSIKISLIVSKENINHKDDQQIEQILSNNSSLIIHGIEGLKSKRIIRSISIELPSPNLSNDLLNKKENSLINNQNNQQIIENF